MRYTRRAARIHLFVFLVAACGGATATSGDRSDGGDTAATTVDPDCPGRGIERRKPAPSGACDAGAVCEYRTPRGACGPSGAYAPPKEWRCTCASGTWDCAITGGPLGVDFCDAAADPTKRDASPADGASGD